MEIYQTLDILPALDEFRMVNESHNSMHLFELVLDQMISMLYYKIGANLDKIREEISQQNGVMTILESEVDGALEQVKRNNKKISQKFTE